MTPQIESTNTKPGPTGPRTPAGKSRCRLNAVRHGLTGQSLYFTPDEAEAYTTHSASIHSHYQPHGPIGEALRPPNRGRHLAPRPRLRAIEHGIFALALEAPDPNPDEDPDPNPPQALSPARAWLAEGKNLDRYQQSNGIGRMQLEILELLAKGWADAPPHG